MSRLACKASSCAVSIKLMHEMWRGEEEKDAMVVKIMIQIKLLARCMRVFIQGTKMPTKACGHPRDENHGRNYEYIAESRSQEIEEYLQSKIESFLKMVLERVVSTDMGIRELKDDLLELTQMLKDHEMSIRHLEENDEPFGISNGIWG
ncbi:hypothetical protein HAX54_026848, partial [Datura stramonium]|nr:hypothetical protein [Datura stramonium]